MITVRYALHPASFKPKASHAALKRIQKMTPPTFEAEKPDLSYLKQKCSGYQKFKNFIFIGNGGSRTNAWAFCHALIEKRNNANIVFLNSSEPERISTLKKMFFPKDTLVLITSKSGDNINAMEPLLFFLDYPVLAITGADDNPLAQIARIKGWDTIDHPEVGGRYSGMTSCGLVPAALAGLNIEKIYAGAKAGYKKYNSRVSFEKNVALQLAAYLFQWEAKGYDQIFTGIYSTALTGFLPLITQLIHESCGKNGKGQSIFGGYAPETQHHTNQRFFGGQQNVVGLFMGVQKPVVEQTINIPNAFRNITFRSQTMRALHGLKTSDAMKYDMQGVLQHAKRSKIPTVSLMVDEVSEKSVGEFMVFWQYFAMYSALLRNQNPFDQPEVEYAKNVSFTLRVNRK